MKYILALLLFAGVAQAEQRAPVRFWVAVCKKKIVDVRWHNLPICWAKRWERRGCKIRRGVR